MDVNYFQRKLLSLLEKNVFPLKEEMINAAHDMSALNFSTTIYIELQLVD